MHRKIFFVPMQLVLHCSLFALNIAPAIVSYVSILRRLIYRHTRFFFVRTDLARLMRLLYFNDESIGEKKFTDHRKPLTSFICLCKKFFNQRRLYRNKKNWPPQKLFARSRDLSSGLTNGLSIIIPSEFLLLSVG